MENDDATRPNEKKERYSRAIFGTEIRVGKHDLRDEHVLSYQGTILSFRGKFLLI